ncbi:MAG: HAD family acid phosphatase [Campylobacterales bacterium]
MPVLRLSSLPHTWLIDIDGTILRHNGHKEGKEELLPGVLEFWKKIPKEDTIILLSARTEEEKPQTLRFLQSHGLHFHEAIFGLPKGERILLNDSKPQGLNTALAVNVARDAGLGDLKLIFDPTL